MDMVRIIDFNKIDTAVESNGSLTHRKTAQLLCRNTAEIVGSYDPGCDFRFVNAPGKREYEARWSYDFPPG